jgi:hypothetical protein
MGLISRAWTNLAPPGAISPPDDLTGPPVRDQHIANVPKADQEEPLSLTLIGELVDTTPIHTSAVLT